MNVRQGPTEAEVGESARRKGGGAQELLVVGETFFVLRPPRNKTNCS